MPKHRIKILHIFFPDLREIYLFGKNDSFFSKTKVHFGIMATKQLFERLNHIFLAKFCSLRVKWDPTISDPYILLQFDQYISAQIIMILLSHLARTKLLISV